MYANIKIPNSPPAACFTKLKIKKLRKFDELRFLCIKKQNLNTTLYKIHLELAKMWSKIIIKHIVFGSCVCVCWNASVQIAQQNGFAHTLNKIFFFN